MVDTKVLNKRAASFFVFTGRIVEFTLERLCSDEGLVVVNGLSAATASIFVLLLSVYMRSTDFT